MYSLIAVPRALRRQSAPRCMGAAVQNIQLSLSPRSPFGQPPGVSFDTITNYEKPWTIAPFVASRNQSRPDGRGCHASMT